MAASLDVTDARQESFSEADTSRASHRTAEDGPSETVTSTTRASVIKSEGIQKEFVSEAFPENLLNKLNHMRHMNDAPWCDVTFKCQDGEAIRAHSCILNNIFELDSNVRVIQIDFDSKVLASFVDYCYTGRLRMTTDNIADLFQVAESLKLQNEELRKELDTFLVDNLRAVAACNDVVVKLREETLRRVLTTDAQKAGKMSAWCYLLFHWWSADMKTRSEAFVEFMKSFKLEDLDGCIGQVNNPFNSLPLFRFGASLNNTSEGNKAENDEASTQNNTPMTNFPIFPSPPTTGSFTEGGKEPVVPKNRVFHRPIRINPKPRPFP